MKTLIGSEDSNRIKCKFLIIADGNYFGIIEKIIAQQFLRVLHRIWRGRLTSVKLTVI